MWVLDANIATLYNHEVQINQSAMQNQSFTHARSYPRELEFTAPLNSRK